MNDLKPGARVLVPFGFHDLEGTIIRVDVTGLGTRVTVELRIEGTDEPLLTTYPADQVRLAAAA